MENEGGATPARERNVPSPAGSAMTRSRYVQYGCGFSAPEGWRNFDASPTLRFERLPLLGKLYTRNAKRFPENVEYGDIVKGLPVAPDSCDAVYSSHVLEHLSLDGMRTALRNTFVILRPGGTFRLVVPDLEQCVRQYLDDKTSDAALSLMRSTTLGVESRPTSLKGFLAAWLGNSQHLWMWDQKAMDAELRSAGFERVRRAALGDSPDPKFREVEEKERWDDCLGMEGTKPVT